MTKKGIPKRDGSGQGKRKNYGRGGCKNPTSKGRTKKMNEREALRNFIMENVELDEDTISANLNIPTNIGGWDSDEAIPDDVHDHEIDDPENTGAEDRTGYMGIKAGSGQKDPSMEDDEEEEDDEEKEEEEEEED